MTNDAHLFRNRRQLEDGGWQLHGNCFKKNGAETWFPIFEGKMTSIFDHRKASIILNQNNALRQQQPDDSSLEEHKDASFVPQPFLWCPESEARNRTPNWWSYQWLPVFKRVTASTNERTMLPCIVPWSSISYTLYTIFVEDVTPKKVANLITCFSSHIFDYILRGKTSQSSLPMGIVYETAVVSPEYAGNICIEILYYILELTYTAWDLEPFAKDCEYNGPPFRWDEERRFIMRCELDAAFFHLYLGTQEEWQNEGTCELLESFTMPRDAVGYIMETFSTVRRRDEETHGYYQTKETILQIYDEMAVSIRTGNPYQTILDPPPGPPTRPDGTFMSYQEFAHDPPPHIHPPRDGHAITDALQLSDLADTFPNRPFTVGLGVSTEAGQLRVVPKAGQQLQAGDSVLIAHPQLERRGTSTPVAWGELRFSDYRDATSGELYRSASIRGEDGVAQLRISEQEWNQLTTVGSVEEVNQE